MIEVPTILDSFVDSDGYNSYVVQYADGRTESMTAEQYDYLQASAEAQQRLSETISDQPASDPVIDASGLPEYVTAPAEVDLPFIGSTTAYDDAAADTPALYANLPVVSNSFTNIMDWFGDTFFIERTQTVHKSGYTSERYSYNSATQLIQLPYEEDLTETVQVLNPQACVSAVLVVLVFVTTVTWIKNAIFGRMS